MSILTFFARFFLKNREKSISDFKANAKKRYPVNASNTCCHGLVEFGFLINTFLLFELCT